jgi:hypothetical protein
MPISQWLIELRYIRNYTTQSQLLDHGFNHRDLSVELRLSFTGSIKNSIAVNTKGRMYYRLTMLSFSSLRTPGSCGVGEVDTRQGERQVNHRRGRRGTCLWRVTRQQVLRPHSYKQRGHVRRGSGGTCSSLHLFGIRKPRKRVAEEPAMCIWDGLPAAGVVR